MKISFHGPSPGFEIAFQEALVFCCNSLLNTQCCSLLLYLSLSNRTERRIPGAHGRFGLCLRRSHSSCILWKGSKAQTSDSQTHYAPGSQGNTSLNKQTYRDRLLPEGSVFRQTWKRPCSQMAHVFVYGTLKRGQPNHKVLLDSANGSAAFQGQGRTAQPFPLVIAGEHNIPWLLHLPGQGHRVAGEVYRVDEQMLRFLDGFEGCPDMYQRTALPVEVLTWQGEGSPGDSVQCFVYSTATYPPEWVHLPYHESYDCEGPHGLRYNPRENR